MILYDNRILFPMDMFLIRKLIVITREFEMHVDDVMASLVAAAAAQASSTQSNLGVSSSSTGATNDASK